MATAKNKKLYYTIGAAILAIGGYVAYRQYKKKNEELPTPEPEPLPPVKEKPKVTPTKTQSASAAKIAEMQNLMIKRFEQLNRASEYTAAMAKGGWGAKSRAAIAKLMPTNAKNFGDPNADNVDKYISALSKDVQTAAQQEKNLETAQKSADAKKKLATATMTNLEKGGKAVLLVKVTSPLLKYDTVKNTYIPISGKTRTFEEGYVFRKGDLFDRGNGQLLFVYGDNRYPIDPTNLLNR